jgi:hypothetical protein
MGEYEDFVRNYFITPEDVDHMYVKPDQPFRIEYPDDPVTQHLQSRINHQETLLKVLEERLATLENRFRHVCEYNGFWDGS